MSEYNLQVFGFRLKQARVRAKLSLEALAEKMGGTVTKQSLSKFEKAQMAPSFKTLNILAEALNTNLDFFNRPITPDLQNLEVSFRKKSNVGAKEIAALKVEIQDEIERFLEIETILGKDETTSICDSNINVLSTSEQMIDQARQLRKKWNLGSAPIANIQDTLEKNGIKIIFSKGPIGFDGVSGRVNKNKFIMVLNSNVDMAERRRFTAMHELAHLLFNSNFNEELNNHDRESLCNVFANEMLLPGEYLQSHFDGKQYISIKELIYIQETYGISIDAIIHKLKDLGIMSESRYRSYNVRLNTNPDFKKTIQNSRFEEIQTPRFEAMVYGALASKLITETKAASLLRLPLETIQNNTLVV